MAYETKLSELRLLMARQDYRAALKLAASWGRGLGTHQEVITRGWEAMARPEWMEALGKNPKECIATALDAIRIKYNLPREDAKQVYLIGGPRAGQTITVPPRVTTWECEGPTPPIDHLPDAMPVGWEEAHIPLVIYYFQRFALNNRFIEVGIPHGHGLSLEERRNIEYRLAANIGVQLL